ncbi:MAG: leucine-rich repeat protein [Candidatus Methanomethylophilaceae archaeon]|nr:leucine-rich repeat protein [Candidatus Methanomethylophilaceae archaeon]
MFISGSYSIGKTPWYYLYEVTDRIIVEEGVTSIGKNAFGGDEYNEIGAFSLDYVCLKTVNTVRSKAFFECSIKTIEMPEVTIIGDEAFLMCGIDTLYLPEVVKIGDYAFGMGGVSKHVFMPKINTIGLGAFDSELESVYFGSSLRNIDAYSFYDNTFKKLNGVTVSDANSLRGKLFTGTGNGVLTETTTTINAPYATVDGMRYELSFGPGHIGLCLTEYNGDDCSVCIPNVVDGIPVKSVGDYAFANCVSLESLIFGNSLNQIGSYAFYGCSSLSVFDLPDALITIKEGAFSMCSGVSYVSFPEGLESVEKNAFDGLSFYGPDGKTLLNKTAETLRGKEFSLRGDRLCQVPDVYAGLQLDIGGLVFTVTSVNPAEVSLTGYSDAIESLVVPAIIEANGVELSVVSVGNKTFYNCSTLVSADLGSVSEVGYKAFEGCTSLTSVSLPSATSIGDYAFSACTSLTSVSMPSVTFIGDHAFYSCSSFLSVTIPGSVASIGPHAFAYCTSLEQLVIGESVEAIGNEAFSNCAAFSRVILPESIDHVGAGAFDRCTFYDAYGQLLSSTAEDLKGRTYVGSGGVLHAYIESGRVAFSDGLKYKVISESPLEASLVGCEGAIKSLVVPDAIVIDHMEVPVVSIGEKSFYGCTDLLSADLAGVSKIGMKAFARCSNLKSVAMDSIITIGAYAFYRCTSMIHISFSDCLTSVGKESFSGLSFLDSDGSTIEAEAQALSGEVFEGLNRTLSMIRAPDTGVRFASAGLLYEIVSDDPLEAAVVGFDESIDVLTIPSVVSYGGKAVYITSVGDGAFSQCEALSSVDLGGIRAIGAEAFKGCVNLSYLKVPGCLERIGLDAFKNVLFLADDRTTELEPNVANLAGKTFSGKRAVLLDGNSVPTLLFSDGGLDYGYAGPHIVTVLGSSDPDDNLVIPSSVEYNGLYFRVCSVFDWAFAYSDIVSLSIPDGIDIGNGAFYNCESLESVNLDNVSSLGSKSFAKCRSLQSISVSSDVGAYAFYGCTGLREIVITDGVETIHRSGFSACTGLQKVTVSSSVVTIEQNAFYKCTFTDRDGRTLAKTADDLSGRYFEGAGSMLVHSGPVVGESFGDMGLSYRVLTTYPNTAMVVGFEVSLTSVVIPESVHYKGEELRVTGIDGKAFYGYKSLVSANLGSVETVGVKAFANCTNLATVNLGDSVKTVSAYAFYGCKSLRSVALDDDVRTLKTIGSYAFYRCGSLVDVVVPSTVKTIGKNVFSVVLTDEHGIELDTDSLPGYSYSGRTRVADVLEGMEFESGGLHYRVISAVPALASVTGCDTSIRDLVVPCRVDHDGRSFRVISICDQAFYKSKQISSVDIVYVEKIGVKAFAYCTGIGDVTFGSSLKTVGAYAFYRCTSLESVSIPDSATSLGSYSFFRCTSLQDVDMGQGVKTVGSNAFGHCDLGHARISPSLSKMGAKAFDGTTFLMEGREVDPTVANLAGHEFTGSGGMLSEGNECVVMIIAEGCGSVSDERIAVKYGSSVSTESNILTVGGTRVSAIPGHNSDTCSYEFSGWELSGPAISGDTTIKAVFKEVPLMYAVTFKTEGNGATSVESMMVEAGSNVEIIGSTLAIGKGSVAATPGNSTGRFTYSFDGWEDVPQIVTGDTTVTARFVEEVNTYIVAVVADDYGTVSRTEFTVEYGTSIRAIDRVLIVGDYFSVASPNEPDSTYTYTFVRWNGVPDRGSVTDHTVIHARFGLVSNECTVHVIAGDYGTVSLDVFAIGRGTAVSIDGDTVRAGDYASVAIPLVDDVQYEYSFVEWSAIESDENGDMTITARFDRMTKRYLVHLYPDYPERGSVFPETVYVEYGAEVSSSGNSLLIGGYGVTAIPSDPIGRSLFTFDRWEGAPPIIEGDTVIHACFIPVEGEVLVHCVYNNSNVLDTWSSADYGTYVSPPPAPETLEGYVFVGWFSDKECENEFTPIVAKEDVTIYGKYERMACVTFDALGGEIAAMDGTSSGSGLRKYFRIGEPIPSEYDLIAVNKIGHYDTRWLFTGWYKLPDCKDRWAIGEDVVEGDMFLYAGWSEVLEPTNALKPDYTEKVDYEAGKGVRVKIAEFKNVVLAVLGGPSSGNGGTLTFGTEWTTASEESLTNTVSNSESNTTGTNYTHTDGNTVGVELSKTLTVGAKIEGFADISGSFTESLSYQHEWSDSTETINEFTRTSEFAKSTGSSLSEAYSKSFSVSFENTSPSLYYGAATVCDLAVLEYIIVEGNDYHTEVVLMFTKVRPAGIASLSDSLENSDQIFWSCLGEERVEELRDSYLELYGGATFRVDFVDTKTGIAIPSVEVPRGMSLRLDIGSTKDLGNVKENGQYFTHAGWSLSMDGTNPMEEITPTEDCVCYSLWKPNMDAVPDGFDGYLAVYDAASLRKIDDNPSGKYVLTRSFSLPSNWVPLKPFKGTLEGNGEAISNLTIKRDGSSLDAEMCLGLFSSIEYGAIVSDLKLEGCSVYWGSCHDGEGWLLAGILAGKNSGTVDNVEIVGCELQVHRDMSRAGFVVGECTYTGEVRDCKVTGNSILYVNGDAGGICGHLLAGGKVKCSEVNGAKITYYLVESSRSIGGIVGYSEGGAIEHCIVGDISFLLTGNVGANTEPRMGEIVGHQDGGLVYKVGHIDQTVSWKSDKVLYYDGFWLILYLDKWDARSYYFEYGDGQKAYSWPFAGRLTSHDPVIV